MKKASRNLLRNSSQIALFAAAVLVLIITWLVYLPSLNNGFISWDDDKYVYRNQMITHFDPAFLKNAFTIFSVYNWHPLTWISYALDYAVWGLNPLGYHLTNMVIHGLNAFLIVLLIGRLFRCCSGVGSGMFSVDSKIDVGSFSIWHTFRNTSLACGICCMDSGEKRCAVCIFLFVESFYVC